MAHNQTRKQKSLIHSVRDSLRHIRTNKATKESRRIVTPTAVTNATYTINRKPQTRSRTPTVTVSESRKGSITATNKASRKDKKATDTDRLSSKESHAKYLLRINIPSLQINKKPDNKHPNELFCNNEYGSMNKAIIAISIDVEAVYNEEYDNNYNRKILGPIQAVQFPIIIDCVPHDAYAHIEEYDLDEENMFSDEEKELNDFNSAQPIALQTSKWNGRHYKSASVSGANTKAHPKHVLNRTHAPSLSSPRLNKPSTKQRNKYLEHTSYGKQTQRKRVKVRKKAYASTKSIQAKTVKQKVKLEFEDKYNKMNEITPDELEILARKLLREMDDENAVKYEDKNKSHNNVKKKAEAVSFGLQFINSLKQITSSLTTLMETFSDGLNDLLGICQQFMELIVDPLPRPVYNDYAHMIHKYTTLLAMMRQMSVGFDKSSQKLKDNVPIIKNILSSDIGTRLSQYDSYTNDMKMAQNDIKSLQIHCDRSLRRLFREIPKPQHLSQYNNQNETGLLRKRSLKQHKNIRLFGKHYISSNSDEYICRSVPSKIRGGIICNYIHYLTLMDTMNCNTTKCYNQILPNMKVEFEENQTDLTQHINDALHNLHVNISRFNETTNNETTKPLIRRAPGSKPLVPAKAHMHHCNVLMASPMHTYDVITKIDEYVNEESEKKTYDEFEMVKLKKKNFKQQQKQENGKYSLKNYRTHFDSANFINQEVIESFFNNHYYHLGDIMYEIPQLYKAFKNFLEKQLCEENLSFLRTLDDVYFSLENETFNHSTAEKQTQYIYDYFICEKAKNQINIPGNIRKRIENDLVHMHQIVDPLSIFDKAYDAISSLIHKESLPNFYKSQHFKKWYEKQRQENEKLWKKERKMMKK